MERNQPTYVKRFMDSLCTPAINRWQNDPAHRELCEQRSMRVIESPWDAEIAQVGASREFGFLRDFWNQFHECIQSCQSLDVIRNLAFQSMTSTESVHYTATVTFWMESYLNEVYIFQCRLLDLIKFIQRRYKKDADFTEFVIEVGESLTQYVQEQLAPLIKDRGAHVHERRHRLVDPELARLTLLDTMIDELGHVDLHIVREISRDKAEAWLIAQTRHYSDLSWHLFDEVCRGFSDGILLDINRIIVPLHLKDNPEILLEMQLIDSANILSSD